MLKMVSGKVWLSAALVSVLGVAACGDSDSTGGTGGEAGGSSASVGGAGGSGNNASTSSVGGGDACRDDFDAVFAITQIAVGEGDSEWKQLGFNLDGLTSTAASADVCQPSAGGSPTLARPDGDNGKDNSFGKNVLPILLSIYPGWSSDINTALQSGDATSLFMVDCQTAGHASSLTTKLFVGAPLGTTPKLDGTDNWSVAPEFLSDPLDATSSILVFTNGSLNGNALELGEGGEVILKLPIKAQSKTAWIHLALHEARVTMTLAPDGKSGTGMIGGILNTEEFVTEVRRIGDALDLCGSPVLFNLMNTIRQASDILADGTQDPGKTCDGISVGLGFELSAAQLGTVAAETLPSMTCP